jgi:hypothetical protein
MTFTVATFDSAGALQDFVNTEAIVKADIQQIWGRDGKWYLFYWA